MSISTARRTQRIDLRATPRQETLIQQAASQTDRSVSEFILSAATREAERILADRRWFSVTSDLTRDSLVGFRWFGVSFRWYCGVGGLVVGH